MQTEHVSNPFPETKTKTLKGEAAARLPLVGTGQVQAESRQPKTDHLLPAMKNSRSPAGWINLLLNQQRLIDRGDQLFNYRLRPS